VAIKINHISKTYKLYKKPYHRLIELLNLGDRYQEIHALKDVSFCVRKGTTMGIVGPNGSGKSTLLQLISGIIQPTTGNIEVNGRISALLELGAGFNPEYTGRENIFLYASILGVEKKEIEQRLDHIVDFAQIGDFIDRPVKTYSSGMYVRLAFSVAINVDPDILIVDEALAVGDESFQRKCFRKFEELKEKGVTILFVTHSLGLVKQFCDEAVLIYKGDLIEQGHPNHVINVYTKLIANANQNDESMVLEGITSSEEMELNTDVSNIELKDAELSEFRYGNGQGKIVSFRVYGEEGNVSRIFKHGEKINIDIKVKSNKKTSNSLVAYTIKTISGVEVTGTNTRYEGIDLQFSNLEQIVTVSFIQQTLLNAGDYVISFGFVEMNNDELIVFDRRYDAITFKVAENKKAAGLVDPQVKVIVSMEEKGVES